MWWRGRKRNQHSVWRFPTYKHIKEKHTTLYAYSITIQKVMKKADHSTLAKVFLSFKSMGNQSLHYQMNVMATRHRLLSYAQTFTNNVLTHRVRKGMLMKTATASTGIWGKLPPHKLSPETFHSLVNLELLFLFQHEPYEFTRTSAFHKLPDRPFSGLQQRSLSLSLH